MRRIAFVNEKGGSGKTTLTLNVGAWLARQGYKTVIIDMDPQGHIGKSLGMNIHGLDETVFDLLLYPDVSCEDVMVPTDTENLYVIPSNKLLTDVVVNIAGHGDRHTKLREKVRKLKGFDFVLIDSPPSLGLLTVNILVGMEEVVIPVSLTYLALDGCAEILDTVKVVNQNFGHTALHVSLVVPTFYRDTILVKSILKRLKNHFGEKMADTVIGYDMKLDQAQSFGKTIFEFAPESEGAKMMAAVGRELLERGK